MFAKDNPRKIKLPKRGSHDRDRVMLEACFQILVDFFEKEKPYEWCEFESEKEEYEELHNLYLWWKNEGSVGQVEDDYMSMKNSEFCKKYEFPVSPHHYAVPYAVYQKKLEELIVARKYMWT